MAKISEQQTSTETAPSIPKPYPTGGIIHESNGTTRLHEEPAHWTTQSLNSAVEGALRLMDRDSTPFFSVGERIEQEDAEKLRALIDELEKDLMNGFSLEEYEAAKNKISEQDAESLVGGERQAYETISDIAAVIGNDPSSIYKFQPGVVIEDAGGESKIDFTSELKYVTYEILDDEGELRVLVMERSSNTKGNASFVLRNDNGELVHAPMWENLMQGTLSRSQIKETATDEDGNETRVNPYRQINHTYYDYEKDDVHKKNGIFNPGRYQKYLHRFFYWSHCSMDEFLKGDQAVPESEFVKWDKSQRASV